MHTALILYLRYTCNHYHSLWQLQSQTPSNYYYSNYIRYWVGAFLKSYLGFRSDPTTSDKTCPHDGCGQEFDTVAAKTYHLRVAHKEQPDEGANHFDDPV